MVDLEQNVFSWTFLGSVHFDFAIGMRVWRLRFTLWRISLNSGARSLTGEFGWRYFCWRLELDHNLLSFEHVDYFGLLNELVKEWPELFVALILDFLHLADDITHFFNFEFFYWRSCAVGDDFLLIGNLLASKKHSFVLLALDVGLLLGLSRLEIPCQRNLLCWRLPRFDNFLLGNLQFLFLIFGWGPVCDSGYFLSLLDHVIFFFWLKFIYFN